MKVDYTHLVSHQSSREGGRVHLATLHTVEGDMTLESLGSLFDNEEASSHFASDKAGRIARYVEDSAKAWTQCNFNPVSLSLEQAGFAAWSESDWFSRHVQLEAAAKFVLYAHNQHGVPIRKGKVSGGGIVRDGVVQHKDLGAMGCGHSDCGDGYPQGYVELLARYWLARDNGNDKNVRKLGRKVNRWRNKYGIKKVGISL
jgi:hypothetical protein